MHYGGEENCLNQARRGEKRSRVRFSGGTSFFFFGTIFDEKIADEQEFVNVI